MFYVIKAKGEYDMGRVAASRKICLYALPVAGLIIFALGGLTTAGLTFGAVIVIGSFICNMCLGSLFAAVGATVAVATSILIHKAHVVINDEEARAVFMLNDNDLARSYPQVHAPLY
jgi:hypothetical protein